MLALLSFFVLSIASGSALQASSFTLQGTFHLDDNVALFDVTLTQSAKVDFRTFGYAGGTTANGIVVPAGGFDPILTLFDASGAFLAENDDGSSSPVDVGTGHADDADLSVSLAAGHYIVALTQYDNFSIGMLSDGFLEDGNAHFTADPNFSSAGPCPGNLFRDTSGTASRCRNGNWTAEFLNIDSVVPRATSSVPEPSAFAFITLSLAAIVCARRLRLV